MPNPNNSAEMLRSERLDQMIRVDAMRTQGIYNVNVIAEKLGLNAGQVRSAMQRLDKAYGKRAMANMDMRRGEALAMIDRLMQTAVERAEKSSNYSHLWMDQAVKLIDRRAKLLGLDKAVPKVGPDITVNQTNVSIGGPTIEQRLKEYEQVYEQLAGPDNSRRIVEADADDEISGVLSRTLASDNSGESMDS